jgi:hypothetical protein
MPNIHDIKEESTPANVLKKYIKKVEKITGRNIIIYYGYVKLLGIFKLKICQVL